MDSETAIVIFVNHNNEYGVDLEVPLNITANEFVKALNTAYKLEIDISDIKNCYLKAENPIVLLKGNKTLAEFGIRNGSKIHYTRSL